MQNARLLCENLMNKKSESYTLILKSVLCMNYKAKKWWTIHIYIYTPRPTGDNFHWRNLLHAFPTYWKFGSDPNSTCRENYYYSIAW